MTIIANKEANLAIRLRFLEFTYLNIGNRNNFITMKEDSAIKIVFIVNKYIAPPKYIKSPWDKPYPAVHKGGINAVAIATPKITLAIVPFLVLAIIKAEPQKKAIRTSRISGCVLTINSEES